MNKRSPGGHYLPASPLGDTSGGRHETRGCEGSPRSVVRTDAKGRFVQVTEDEDETRTLVTINSPDGVLPNRFRNADAAMHSGRKV